jgi:hypothetical protein
MNTLFNIKFSNHGLEREECNWMCTNYHPYCGCFSFVNIYIVKFTKKGVPFCYQLTRLTIMLCIILGLKKINI